MSKVMPITGAFAAVLAATAPDMQAQVRTGQDTANPTWNRGPTVFRSDTARDTTRDTTGATWRRGPTVFSSDTTGDSAVARTAAVADSAYIGQAISGNLLEVRLGRVAQARAEDSDVEDFAERMISEHGTTNQQWATLARNNRMPVAMTLDPMGERTVDRLKDLSGDAFDQAYMSEMIRHHEQTLAAFQRMASSARSNEVRQLATNGLTSIREHLVLARQIGSRVGVATTATRTGVVTPTPVPDEDDERQAAADRAARNGQNARDARDRNDRDDDRGNLRAEDRAFLRNVLADHLMHIRLAERAQREARDGETRRLAERMEDDFTEWQKRWENFADRHDVQAPDNLGKLHGQKVERLEQASRRNVDRTYAAIVADHLESVVPYFQKEGQAVRSSAMRRLVNEELPVIREHLERARRLQRQASARAE